MVHGERRRGRSASEVLGTIQKDFQPRTEQEGFSWEPESSGFSEPRLRRETVSKRKKSGLNLDFSQSKNLLISNQFLRASLKENQKKMLQCLFPPVQKKKKKPEKKIVWGLETERVPSPFIDDVERVAVRH